MSTTLFDLSVGSYIQIVEAAVKVMQKGATFCQENGKDTGELVSSCLREDMASFHFQAVCIAHHSIGAIRGMQAGEFGPPTGYPDMDYAGLQGLVSDALTSLRELDPDAVNALAGKKVIFKLGGNEIPFTAENFVLSFSLPNFYFHATTAYDILRHNGVPLGKRDFLGNMRMG